MIEVVESPLYKAQTSWDELSPIERSIRWLLFAVLHGALLERGWKIHAMSGSKYIVEFLSGPMILMENPR